MTSTRSSELSSTVGASSCDVGAWNLFDLLTASLINSVASALFAVKVTNFCMLLLSGLRRLRQALIELRDELRDCTARDAFSQSSGQSAVLEPAAVLPRVYFLSVFQPLSSLNDLASPVYLWNLDSLLSHPRPRLDRYVSEAVVSCPPTSRAMKYEFSFSTVSSSKPVGTVVTASPSSVSCIAAAVSGLHSSTR